MYEALQPWIKYKTNDNILLGMGYTYSFLTINLGVKLPFINEDDELYGKSRYIDLQTNFLFSSYIVDLYLQWNTGYYLSNPDDVYFYWYNRPKYYVGLSFSRFSMSTMAGSYKDWFSYDTAHFRINFVKWIHLKRSIKILRPDLWIF